MPPPPLPGHRTPANPYHRAVTASDARTIERLIRLGVEGINSRDASGDTPLSLAITHTCADDVFAQLFHGGAQLTADDDLLNLAVMCENCPELLLTKCRDLKLLDCVDDVGFSAVHWAIVRRCTETLERLLIHGASPNCRDLLGWTPLHHAFLTGQLDAAQMLLEHGAEPDIGGSDGVLYGAITERHKGSDLADDIRREFAGALRVLVQDLRRRHPRHRLGSGLSYYHMAHLLLLLGDVVNARLAFQRHVPSYRHWDIDCQGCGHLVGTRGLYVCCECIAWVDLCGTCNRDRKNVRPECSKHRMLRVVLPSPRRMMQRFQDGPRSARETDWLKGLPPKIKTATTTKHSHAAHSAPLTSEHDGKGALPRQETQSVNGAPAAHPSPCSRTLSPQRPSYSPLSTDDTCCLVGSVQYAKDGLEADERSRGHMSLSTLPPH